MKTFVRTLAAAAAVGTLGASAAHAQSGVGTAAAETVTGLASGCFYGAFFGTATCTPGSGPTVFGAASYTGGAFSGVTNSLGQISFGSTPGGDSFGTFTVGTTPTTFQPGNFFILRLSFTAPAPGGTTNFLATTIGQISPPAGAGVADGAFRVDYNNVFQDLGGGSPALISVVVNDVDVNPGSSVAQSGFVITNVPTTVPEPATIGLMMTGLAGMGVAGFRRRKSA